MKALKALPLSDVKKIYDFFNNNGIKKLHKLILLCYALFNF